MFKIAFFEWQNEITKQAIFESEGIEVVSCESLEAAALSVREGIADALVGGIDYTSRDIILCCRDIIGVKDKTFSASFWMRNEDREFVIGDAAACKNPTEEQLYDIVLQTYETAKKVLAEEPRVAILSFSTLGSGGKDASIERAQNVVARVRREHPEIIIDGELQLDAAINPRVASKKVAGSRERPGVDLKVAGRANVLIVPDLNSGNILYKAMEQFGGFTAAGPILQGFKAPISDLSRGSTVNDVKLVIKAIKKIGESRS